MMNKAITFNWFISFCLSVGCGISGELDHGGISWALGIWAFIMLVAGLESIQ